RTSHRTARNYRQTSSASRRGLHRDAAASPRGSGRAAVANLAAPGSNRAPAVDWGDRKSTRLNSSHLVISYAVFCLKKKTHTSYAHSQYQPSKRSSPASHLHLHQPRPKLGVHHRLAHLTQVGPLHTTVRSYRCSHVIHD